jgi:hypothetical protein
VVPVVTSPRTLDAGQCNVDSDLFQVELRRCGHRMQAVEEKQTGVVQVESHMQACILLRQPDRLKVRDSKAYAALPKHLM